jgi:hypothetical protein
MREFARLIQPREPDAHDGVMLLCECNPEPLHQNAFYDGFYSDTYVSNVFAFAPTGKIFLAFINYPGSWHDAMIVAPVLQEIKERLNGMKICVGQGFLHSGGMNVVFVGPIYRKRISDLSHALRPRMIRMFNVHTDLRQAAEWRCKICRVFGQWKCRLPSDAHKRHDLLEVIALLHNYRTHHENNNQITTVFSTEYEGY